MADDYELNGPWTGTALRDEVPTPPRPRYRERLLTPLSWWVLGGIGALCVADLIVRSF